MQTLRKSDKVNWDSFFNHHTGRLSCVLSRRWSQCSSSITLGGRYDNLALLYNGIRNRATCPRARLCRQGWSASIHEREEGEPRGTRRLASCHYPPMNTTSSRKKRSWYGARRRGMRRPLTSSTSVTRVCC